MTISTTSSSVTLGGNGATSAFQFSFIAGAASNIVVTYVDALGNATVLTSSQYTLTLNAAAAGQLWGVGGSVTYPISGSAILAGTTLTISRILPLTQTTSISNQGDFYPQAVEQALDTLCLEIQQAVAAIAGAIRIPLTDPQTGTLLPTALLRANAYLAFDANGNVQVLPIASSAPAGVQTLVGALIAGNPSIPVNEIANALPTNSTLAISGTTASNTIREILVSVNFTSNKGVPNDTYTDKVAMYIALEAQAGTGDVCVFNILGWMQSGSGTSYSYECAEFDTVNDAGNRELPITAPMQAAIGLNLTSNSSGTVYQSTAALAISGPGSSASWSAGILVDQNCIGQSTILDLTDSPTVLESATAHGFGINFLNGTFSGAAVALPNNGPIIGANAAGSAEYLMLSAGTNNNVILGSSGWGGIQFQSSLVFASDNTFSVGNGSARAVAIWAVNGTIQTSDVTLKTDITKLSDLPKFDVNAVIDAIEPITFRWTEGGVDLVETDGEVTEHASVEHIKDTTETYLDDKGVARTRPGTRRRKVLQYTNHTALDASGGVVMVASKIKRAVRDAAGAPVLDAVGKPVVVVETVTHPLIHREPVMVTRTGKVMKEVPRPGKRTHWGFDAAAIGAVFAGLGLDFGGFIKDDAGGVHMRPDQMIPLLWEHARQANRKQVEAEARTVALEARMTALETRMKA